MKHFMTLSTCIKLLGLTMMIQCGSASSAEVVNTDLGIFISGGIGLDERQEMYANRDQYNLRLSFAKATGAYISGVNVTIEPLSAKGTAMHCPDAGPLLFLSLIPGKYRISAAFEDKTQVLTVIVSPLASERVLYWP
jgi:hypothetical protein